MGKLILFVQDWGINAQGLLVPRGPETLLLDELWLLLIWRFVRNISNMGLYLKYLISSLIDRAAFLTAET